MTSNTLASLCVRKRQPLGTPISRLASVRVRRRPYDECSGRKFLGVFLHLFLIIPYAVFAQDDATSRYGRLSIQNEEQEFKHRLIVDDKPVYEYEGKSIEILDVLKGTGRDFVIVAAYSGGIACPAKVVIVELRASRRPIVSEEFGSCADSISYRLAGNSVTVDTPGYVPHPELVSKSWARRMARTIERYTWSKGKLSRRYVRISHEATSLIRANS